MSEAKAAIYEAQGFGGGMGMGRKPALCIVDFVNGFTDPAQFGGGNILPAVHRTRDLLAAMRQRGLPIVFTRVIYGENGLDDCVFLRKVPSLATLTETAACSQVVDELAPLPGEYIVRKTQPSAFFGNSLASWLSHRGVDTLLVAGCTTSGCVRATVVDAMGHNFRPIVVEDCVGDRSLDAHEANLFDMRQKYADITLCCDVLAALAKLPA